MYLNSLRGKFGKQSTLINITVSIFSQELRQLKYEICKQLGIWRTVRKLHSFTILFHLNSFVVTGNKSVMIFNKAIVIYLWKYCVNLYDYATRTIELFRLSANEIGKTKQF
jgi:hypothetical protein